MVLWVGSASILSVGAGVVFIMAIRILDADLVSVDGVEEPKVSRGGGGELG